MSSCFPINDAVLSALGRHLLEDYQSVTPPFESRHLPVKKVVGDLKTPRERSIFLTLVAAVNYRKETAGPAGLWKTMKQIWEQYHWVFEPETLVKGIPYERLIDLFEKYSILAWRDPHIWFRNALTFHRGYGGDPRVLFVEHSWNAVNTLQYMHDNGEGFPYLKGPKISSLWLRLIHEEVHELNAIEEIGIPVDKHIRALTKRIAAFARPASQVADRDIQQKWAEVCREIGTYPVRLDQPLWLVEKNWTDWGELYVTRVIKKLKGSIDT